MNNGKDKKLPGTPTPAEATAKRSGRVAFDARGNPTWEWQTATGIFGRDVSTQRLKKLEAKELSLMDTQAVPVPKRLTLEQPPPMPGGGSNPYDSGRVAPSKPSHATSLKAGKVASKDEWWTKKKKRLG